MKTLVHERPEDPIDRLCREIEARMSHREGGGFASASDFRRLIRAVQSGRVIPAHRGAVLGPERREA